MILTLSYFKLFIMVVKRDNYNLRLYFYLLELFVKADTADVICVFIYFQRLLRETHQMKSMQRWRKWFATNQDPPSGSPLATSCNLGKPSEFQQERPLGETLLRNTLMEYLCRTSLWIVVFWEQCIQISS